MLAKLIDRARRGPRYRYRDAGTGKYVTHLYALLHPKTTVRERLR